MSQGFGIPPPPPPPPPPPFPAAPPPPMPVMAGPNYLALAIELIARNNSAMGTGGIRGLGFLDLRGTSGGLADRVRRYLEYAAQSGGAFPYWTLDLVQKANILAGQPVTAQPSPGNPFGPQTPRGTVPFVIMLDGSCRIGPSLRIGMPVTTNHCYISDMAPQVAFAGEMTFGGILPDREDQVAQPAGVLVSWSNNSGGYRCQGHDARRVGLPMNLYSGPAPAERDYIDTYASGRGKKINWGRHGPPQIVQRRQQDYWTQ